MANYTMELREVLSQRKLFNFNYDFYDEKARPTFERDFIRHFYFREICTENPDKFLWLLEDKMNTVFPYYNELFRTAQIEYSVLDNYYMNEKITRNQENTGRTSGVSSNILQSFDTTKTTSINSGRDTTELNHKSDTSTEGTGKDSFVNTSTIDTREDRTGSPKTEFSEDVSKKFLDTPQGSVNINDANYITTLNADKKEQLTKNTIDDHTITDQDGRNEGQTDRENSSETSVQELTTGLDEHSTTGATDYSGEHRSTGDNNTRTQSEGAETETIQTERRGNIGVDADADLIQKHIKLQQILKKISLMFFDECEDLFMGLY